MASTSPRYDDLSALFINCTLKPSPELSHTQGLIAASAGIMAAQGARTEIVRAVDHDIATGVWPDMTEHGAATDAWPRLYPKVLAADILVIAGPIWLGDNSSVTGGALMIPSTLSIISNMFRDPAERQRAIGRWGATSGIGVALGPIIGGFLLARFWWGSVFLINVPIALAGLLAACWLVPDSKNPAAKAPDLAGAGLSVAGIGVILWSIIDGPARGWSSPVVIGAGAGGLAVLALFAFWERITGHPMLNLSFFRQRPFSAVILAVLALTFGLFGALFVLTQFLQLFLGFTALQAGIRLLPFAAAVIVVAPASAVAVRAIALKLTIAAGLALVAAGLWLISVAAVSTAFAGLAAGMVLLGAGAGLALPTATGSVVGSVPRPTAASPPPPTRRPSSSAARSAWRSSAACWRDPLPGPDDRRPARSAAPRHRQELPRRRARRRPGRRHHRIAAHPPSQDRVRQRHGPGLAHRRRGRRGRLPGRPDLPAGPPRRRPVNQNGPCFPCPASS